MITIDEILKDHQPFHSELQMDSFITIRAGGTLYGCYRQAVREIDTRARALRERDLFLELALIDIEEWETEPDYSFEGDVWHAPGTATMRTTFDLRRNKAKAQEKRRALPEVYRAIEDTERELAHFVGQALAIRKALESRGVKFPLDAATRDRLDREMWEHQLKSRAAIELLATGRIANTTLELIQSCPAQMREAVCRAVFLKEPQPLFDWFMEFDAGAPEPIVIERSKVRGLLGCSE